MADSTIIMKDINGNVVAVKAVAVGDGTYRLAVDAALDVGDISIGAVELKDSTTDTRAKVTAGSSIVAADNAIAVHDANPQQVDTIAQVVGSAVRLRPTGGARTVAATGTAEPLVDVATPALMVCVVARLTNTGNVYFGDSLVNKTTSKQLILAPGMSAGVDAPLGYRIDAHDFYIDADVNAEGVDFVYVG